MRKIKYSKTRKMFAKGTAIIVGAAAALAIVSPVNANEYESSGIMFEFEDGTGYYVEDSSHIYSDTGMVMKMEVVSSTETMLTIATANGNEFQWITEDGDWFLRDFGAMTMDSKGTEEVDDDVIIMLEYSGVIWQFKELMNMMYMEEYYE